MATGCPPEEPSAKLGTGWASLTAMVVLVVSVSVVPCTIIVRFAVSEIVAYAEPSGVRAFESGIAQLPEFLTSEDISPAPSNETKTTEPSAGPPEGLVTLP